MSWRPRRWQAWMPGILHFWQKHFFFITTLTYTSSLDIIDYVSYINSTPSIPKYLSFWIFKYIYFFIYLDIYLCLLRNWGSHRVLEQLQQFSFPSCHCFFCENRKTFSNISPSQVAIYSKLEKTTPRVHLWAQRSAAHPCELEEVEGYKNNYVFYQHFWFNFSVDGRVET
jgi:hypothetical protein